MKVKIFDTAANNKPGTCYFDLQKEIEQLQEKYEIKDIKTIMRYPNSLDVMVAIFYEEPYVAQVKKFNWTYSEEDENRFLSSHDVIKVEHFADEDGDVTTIVTYKESVDEND